MLADFLHRHGPVVALTGAGLSAGSGIPTYRNHSGQWMRSDPIQHQDFIQSPLARKRYWGRSLLGWPMVSKARPNSAHHALAALEEANFISLIVTQNVDRLHQRAGSTTAVDLHGRLDQVICLSCKEVECRSALQERLQQSNPALAGMVATHQPDGDADLEDKLVDKVEIPRCMHCAGTLMPDVVFYGGSVPRDRVERASEALEQANGLLVVGSSLQVFSGYRFCRQARKWGKPIAAINLGRTRAEDILALKVEENCETALRAAMETLGISTRN